MPGAVQFARQPKLLRIQLALPRRRLGRVAEVGLRAAGLWKEIYPGLVRNGSLVVAAPRDQTEMRRFSSLTVGHTLVDEQLARTRYDKSRPLLQTENPLGSLPP